MSIISLETIFKSEYGSGIKSHKTEDSSEKYINITSVYIFVLKV